MQYNLILRIFGLIPDVVVVVVVIHKDFSWNVLFAKCDVIASKSCVSGCNVLRGRLKPTEIPRMCPKTT